MSFLVYVIGIYFMVCGVGYVHQDYKDYKNEAFHNTEGFMFFLVGVMIVVATFIISNP